MNLFYTEKIESNKAFFDKEETQHLSNSLRKSVGAKIFFTDGKGFLYEGQLVQLTKKGAEVEIVQKNQHPRKRIGHLEIAIAPTKNINRIEWFIEKSIEIGIDAIQFIQSAHSERKVIKIDRLKRIAIGAMKQSLNVHLPEIKDMMSFDSYCANQTFHTKLIASLDEPTLQLNEIEVSSNTTCLIGPEGGFRAAEVTLAKSHGFQPITLGNRRLRTETAGIVATTLLHERLKTEA